MRWFRAQGRASPWVALFALLIQFAVSFGHVHIDHGQAPHPAASALATGDHTPAPDEDHADDACAICILNQMLGTAQTAAPPVLAPTPVSHATEQTCACERIGTLPRSAAFLSRAPPLA